MTKWLLLGSLLFLQPSFAGELIEASNNASHVLLGETEHGLVLNIRGVNRQLPSIYVNDRSVEWGMVSHGPTVSTGYIAFPEKGSLIVINGVSLIWGK